MLLQQIYKTAHIFLPFLIDLFVDLNKYPSRQPAFFHIKRLIEKLSSTDLLANIT